MPNNMNDALVIKVIYFLSKMEERFLELAALLRELQDKNPEAFKSVISIPELGRRKAYYLVSIDRAFGGHPHLRERLMNVGWTRLAFAAPLAAADDVEDVLIFAEMNSAWAIQQALKGEDLPVGTRSVLLHFSPEQFAFFREEIVKHGAAKNGEGFVGKEVALIAALKKAASNP